MEKDKKQQTQGSIMKALYCAKPGLENVQFGDLPTPKPGTGEVLVRLAASSLNHLDLWLARGHPSYPVPYPHVLGSDGAGTIEAVGPSTSAEVGQKVVLSPLYFCGRCDSCRRGLVSSCDFSENLGAQRPGTHAEYVVVRVKNAILVNRLSLEQAACLPIGALTAYHMLKMADVQAGQTVLVWGASSSVGSFGINIAKLMGASVLTTAASDKVEKAAKTFGVPVIDYQTKSVSEGVKELTAGQGVDAVLEFVGPATFEESCRSVRKGGVIVTCGAVSGPKIELDLRWLYSRQVRIQGSKQGTPEEFLQVLEWAEKELLTPVIGARYPLRDGKDALEELERGKQFGKIVLTR